MKKIIICAWILIVSAPSFSQQTTTNAPVLTKADYLQKSKKQKTAAWILLGGGSALIVTGQIVYTNYINSSPDFGTGLLRLASWGTGPVLELIGLLSMGGSIPLFIASTKNKRRAMNATTFFKMETAPVIQHSSFVQTSFPAVSLKISS